MIYKAEGYKNGFKFDKSTTDADLQEALRPYKDSRNLHCLICNANTMKQFKVGILSDNIITINNKIADDCFFVNGCY